MSSALLGHPARNAILFCLLALGVIGCSSVLAANLATLENASVLAIAMTIDLTVVIPVAYFLFVVRRYSVPWLTIIPVTIGSWLIAKFMIPAEHGMAVNVVEWLLMPLELTLVGFIVFRAVTSIQKARRAGDASQDVDYVAAIQRASLEFLQHPFAARVFAYEVSILYYGLVSWFGSAKPNSTTARDFTCYREPNYSPIFAGLLMVVLIETVAAHLLLSLYVNGVLAWVLTALSIYATIWLLGDFQALRLRTVRVERQTILLRCGMRLDAAIPFEDVVLAKPCKQVPQSLGKTDINASLLDQPTVEMQFSKPVECNGFYGRRSYAERLFLSIDDADRFLAMIPGQTEAESSVDDVR